MAAELLLRADDLAYRPGGRPILEGVGFELRRGQITTVIGPNGAGKTTLANIVGGLIDDHTGVIERAAGLRIGYLPQRVYVNTLMPLTVARLLQLTRRADDGEIEAALARTGVAALARRQVRSLSEGELKRVLLARTTLGQPDLLILDEPTAGVDVTGEARMYELIGELRDELGCAVLLVSHDLHLVMSRTDQVLCLNRHLCCSGAPEAVTRHPEYLALFGEHGAGAIAIYAHEHDHVHDVSGRPREHRHD